MTYEGPERRVSTPNELIELRLATQLLTERVGDLTGALDKVHQLQLAQEALRARQAVLEQTTPTRDEVRTSQAKVRADIRRRAIATVVVFAVIGLVLALALLTYTRSVGAAGYNDCLAANKNRMLFKQYMSERAAGGDEAAKTVLKNYSFLSCSKS